MVHGRQNVLEMQNLWVDCWYWLTPSLRTENLAQKTM